MFATVPGASPALNNSSQRALHLRTLDLNDPHGPKARRLEVELGVLAIPALRRRLISRASTRSDTVRVEVVEPLTECVGERSTVGTRAHEAARARRN